MKRWFAVKMLFESVHGDIKVVPSEGESDLKWFEESIVIFQAVSAEQAEELAVRHAQQSEHVYRNSLGETVTWRLVRVIRTFALNDDVISDETEIYSNFIVAKGTDSIS